MTVPLSDIFAHTLHHLYLTLLAVAFAVGAGVSLGVALTRYTRWASVSLGILGVIQTIPSLALLGFLLPFLGIGTLPALVALFLYALLPIVRNTFVGIRSIEADIRESAVGLGFTDWQLLLRVELPLALPTIFAGIRTAAVINVGVATLCALIGAGGLGEYIFKGIALNQPALIWAGAVPAALLAVLLDAMLALVQTRLRTWGLPFAGGLLCAILVANIYPYFQQPTVSWRFASDAEFVAREDGLIGLSRYYNIDIKQWNIREMDAALMYPALHKAQVDIIGGYSSDGRIRAYNLTVLQDDKQFFPPYKALPLVSKRVQQQYPDVVNALLRLEQLLSDVDMQRLNFEADSLGKSPATIAKRFLESKNIRTDITRAGKAHIRVGGKKFTEQYILAEMFKAVIENYTALTVEIKGGLGGTQVVFEALRLGEIDVYAEYTGTALLSILQPDNATKTRLLRANPTETTRYVQAELLHRFGVRALAPLGFNNAYCLMMRRDDATTRGIKKISDLR